MGASQSSKEHDGGHPSRLTPQQRRLHQQLLMQHHAQQQQQQQQHQQQHLHHHQQQQQHAHHLYNPELQFFQQQPGHFLTNNSGAPLSISSPLPASAFVPEFLPQHSPNGTCHLVLFSIKFLIKILYLSQALTQHANLQR